ncbi:DUF1641 domain-containing protein [Haloplanus sp. C73]|uniref:DUF1641 domain-containing protein n=1 Tax=Haloplanus sp. C73 TaxID=3421641 RepID=UPI003EB7AFD8
MAEPRDTYPETATHGVRKERSTGEGERALRDAISNHGDALAALVEQTDELETVLTTAILVAASADDPELEHITDSTANLVDAADGISTAETAALAGVVGENADDLSASLETVLRLQREGQLDDLVTLSTAFADSLSADEIDDLAALLETGGTGLVDALEAVIELQQEGHLDELVALAKTASALDIDRASVEAVNDVAGAVGEAQTESEPVGFLGALRQLRSPDARAGLGYFVTVLKAHGRRIRER